MEQEVVLLLLLPHIHLLLLLLSPHHLLLLHYLHAPVLLPSVHLAPVMEQEVEYEGEEEIVLVVVMVSEEVGFMENMMVALHIQPILESYIMAMLSYVMLNSTKKYLP